MDIAGADGQRLIRALVAHCDVLVENYKVGTLARYGLDWETLSAINPRLVYCSLTGFGQDGPYAPLPGYDFVFQGMGGLMSITGLPDDEPGGGPIKCGIAISDILGGMYTTTAVLAALEHRRESGRGQYIDLALLDCVVALSSYQATNYFLSAETPPRMGNAHTNMVPYQAFACRDGHVIVAVGNDGQFASFCRVIERPELAADERFARSADRVRNRSQLIPLIAAIMPRHTMAEWIAQMKAANVPCGPIYALPQVFEDPHVVERRIKQMVPHPLGRRDAGARESHPLFGDANPPRAARAHAGPAHRRGTDRSARHVARGRHRPARAPGDLAGATPIPNAAHKEETP